MNLQTNVVFMWKRTGEAKSGIKNKTMGCAYYSLEAYQGFEDWEIKAACSSCHHAVYMFGFYVTSDRKDPGLGIKPRPTMYKVVVLIPWPHARLILKTILYYGRPEQVIILCLYGTQSTFSYMYTQFKIGTLAVYSCGLMPKMAPNYTLRKKKKRKWEWGMSRYRKFC